MNAISSTSISTPLNHVTESLKTDTSFLTGNITPIPWYQHIRTKPTKTKPNGSPDPIAVAILSDIMYWYRPTEVRDENTGNVIGYKQKFRADKLQKNYDSYAELFGVSKKKTKQSFDLLVDLGLITREFRTVNLDNGLKLGNVMFIEPIFPAVKAISINSDTPSPPKRVIGSPPKERGGSLPKRGGHIQRLHPKNTTTTNIPEPFTSSAIDPTPEADDSMPSSFFSPNETNVNLHDLDNLMQMVKSMHRTGEVEARLKRALQDGYDFEYLRRCVGYANEKSNGSSYTAYLGKCIDHPEYHEGFDLDTQMRKLQADIDKLRKQQAEQRKYKKEQLDLKGANSTIDNIEQNDPTRWKELRLQACENLGINPSRPGRGAVLKIRFEIMRILEL